MICQMLSGFSDQLNRGSTVRYEIGDGAAVMALVRFMSDVPVINVFIDYCKREWMEEAKG